MAELGNRFQKLEVYSGFALLAEAAVWSRIVVVAGFILVSNLAPPVSAQESPSFVMDRVSATAVGNTTVSANYETTVVMGQESPTGAVSFCNGGFINSFGFWSVLGDLSVPIRLEVARDSIDPSVVQLSWSGADDLFQVFRSLTPEDALDPLNLDDETSACSAADLEAGSANLIFYQIIAKPGV